MLAAGGLWAALGAAFGSYPSPVRAAEDDVVRIGYLPITDATALMVVERRGRVIVADLGQRVRPDEPFVQQKAAAFVRWHEPDESRGSSPDL